MLENNNIGKGNFEFARFLHSNWRDGSPQRVDTRAGHYQRKLHTKAGEVDLNMPM
jgi:transposase-like protein